MSASPSGPPSGSTPQNGTIRMIRRRKNDNPLVAPKRRPIPQIRAAPPPRPSPSRVIPKSKDALEAADTRDQQQMLDLLKPIMLRADESTSGFTDPKVKEGSYKDYELWTTKRELRAGYRYHLARLLSKNNVDPRNEREFERPVRLHRRDPKNKAASKVEEKPKLEPNGIENKELEEWKAKREEEREANLAQIAPDAVTGQKKKKISSTKAAEVHGIQQTEEQKARSILRYEEAVPWHLEDFENKNTWVGNYEEAMSGVHALLYFNSGQITFLPVEKWYKFTRKDLFKTMTIDEVEDSMKKRVKEPRWMMEHRKREGELKDLKEMSRMNKGLYVGKEAKEDGTPRPGGRRHDEDADEIDAEGADEFADDEEDALFEADEEETKAIQNRLKKDMLKANIFDLKEEKEYEAEERREKKEKEAERVLGKAMRKALKKREKRYVYNSDDSDNYNPFSDSSSSTDSEEERARDAAAKAEQERKAKEKAAIKPGINDKAPSGTSSKGTNTPSGRPKHSDPLKTKNKGLKRPGSPDISDLSGTDTSRKKPKKQHASATGTSTPQPGSRPMSPAFSTATSALNDTKSSSQTSRKSSTIKLKTDGSKTSQSQPLPKKRKNNTGAGSGSDGEGAGTAGSGQEMSDGGTTVKKRLKLNPPGSGSKSPNTATPVGSRASSPKPASGPGTKARAGSAGLETAPPTGAAQQNTNTSFPTISEIRTALPQRGLKIQEITKLFGGRIAGKMKEFSALLREVGEYQKDSGVFVPKK